MEVMEMIKIQAVSMLDELPIPAKELIAVLADAGHTFTELGSYIVLRGTLEHGRIDAVKKVLSQFDVNFGVRHSIWPVFDEQDYVKAPLWILLFPEVWADEVNFANICSVCGIRHVAVDPSVRIQRLHAEKKPIVTVNGQFTVVRDDVRRLIEGELQGANFMPFDRVGEYYYFLANHRLVTV